MPGTSSVSSLSSPLPYRAKVFAGMAAWTVWRKRCQSGCSLVAGVHGLGGAALGEGIGAKQELHSLRGSLTLGGGKVNDVAVALEHVDLLNGLDGLHIELLERRLELLVVGAGSLVNLLDLASGSSLATISYVRSWFPLHRAICCLVGSVWLSEPRNRACACCLPCHKAVSNRFSSILTATSIAAHAMCLDVPIRTDCCILKLLELALAIEAARGRVALAS